MNKWFLTGIVILTPCICVAGIRVEGTRFVYTEGTLQKSITVENSGEQAFLLKTQILPYDTVPGGRPLNSGAIPLLATPPLFVLPGERENKIRLVLTGTSLPKDRESLFDLAITAIPASQQKISANTVQVAIRSHFKLFYRPASLHGNPAKTYQLLNWKIDEQGLKVTNPGPYYATLFDVRINGTVINDPGLVMPYSDRRLSWCKKGTPCDIRLRSIDDYGRVLPPWQVHIFPH